MAQASGTVGRQSSAPPPLPAGLSPPMGWWAILHQPVPSHPRLRALTIQLGLYSPASVLEVGGAAAEGVRKVLTARAADVVAAMEGGATMGQELRDVLHTYLKALGVQVSGALLTGPTAAPTPTAKAPTPPSEGAPGKGSKLVLHDDDMSAAEKMQSNDQAAAQLTQSATGVADAAALLRSDQPAERLQAARLLRKALSIERDPPIDAVLAAGAVDGLVGIVTGDDGEEAQFEAAWALTNIASGDNHHTARVVQAGVVEAFVGKLTAGERLVEQVMWGLGNIAGDSAAMRDKVLASGALEACVGQLMTTHTLSMLRNGTWALTNMVRGKPSPPLDTVAPAIPYLARAVMHRDEEVLQDAMWGLCYISDGTNDRIAKIIDAGVVPRMVECLMHARPTIVVPALRSIGNIVTGDDSQTQVALDAGLMAAMPSLLMSSKATIRKEGCWTLSNITAGSVSQVQMVLDHGLLPMLVKILSEDEFGVSKEAGWAVANALTGGNAAQLGAMVQEPGLIQGLTKLVGSTDPRITMLGLEALSCALQHGEGAAPQHQGVNPVVTTLEACGGLEAIEQAQEHANREVYEKAVNILMTYCEADEEDEGGEDTTTAKDKHDDDQGGSKGEFSFGEEPKQGGLQF